MATQIPPDGKNQIMVTPKYIIFSKSGLTLYKSESLAVTKASFILEIKV